MKNTYSILSRDDFRRLSELGSQSSLSFSSQLVLRNRIIGLDGVKKKLLISESKYGEASYCIIDLDKVKSISVRKSYSGIRPGELNGKQFEEFTKSIHLHFEHNNATEAIFIPIYETEMDDVSDLPRLEAIVKNWQIILSRMISLKGGEVVNEIEHTKLQHLNSCTFHVTTVFK